MGASPIVLSFDVEEHHSIEAADGYDCPPSLRCHYAERMEDCTRWLMDQLAEFGLKATFFLVGQIARSHPALVRDLHAAGHEVASHSWDHQRLHRLTPSEFREDVRRSVGALEDVCGAPVYGYRAPTFSVMRQTAWAVDILAELGLRYDSSVFPVRHDRYGVPEAPRTPFHIRGDRHELLELPPATLRLLGANLPVGGGGYFRLLPLAVLERALHQLKLTGIPGAAVLYFHPWEFDPDQERLPLSRLKRWRTYVGVKSSRPRLRELLARHRFTRAIDAVQELERQRATLPRFTLAA
jgi:polysaccharide deacetylase family protein (PEP-CTERM system associated)